MSTLHRATQYYAYADAALRNLRTRKKAWVMLSGVWTPVIRLANARDVEVSPGVFDTQWEYSYYVGIPVNAPGSPSLHRDDTGIIDDANAPYTGTVFFTPTETEPDYTVIADFYRNGLLENTKSGPVTASGLTSDNIYHHGDDWQVVVWYRSDGGDGPSASTAVGTY